MKISNYLASLLPSFGKERIMEDIGITRRELQTITIPEYQSAVAEFKGWKYKSADVKRLQDTFARQYGRGNMIDVIAKALPDVEKNLTEIESLVTATYNADVASRGMTYKGINLLQLVEQASFISKYARKLLVFVVTAESAEIPNSSTVLSDSLTPAAIRWINENMMNFCQALDSMVQPPVTILKLLNEIPDIIVTPENEGGLTASVGSAKLDPFKTRLIPIWLNPIYHIGMFVADWQAARYKEAQEEMQVLQLRRLNLQKLTAGKPDAMLQERIQKTEDKIKETSYRLAEMEKSYA